MMAYKREKIVPIITTKKYGDQILNYFNMKFSFASSNYKT